jgi:hypothetical protein
MKIQLNGWQRLWVLISILYLLPVAGIAIITWPTPEKTWHRDEFVEQMPAELRAHVDGAYDSKWKWEEALKTRIAGSDDAKTKGPKGKKVSPSSGNPLTGNLEKDLSPTTPRFNLTPPPPDFVLLSEPVSFPNGAILDIHVAKEGDTKADVRAAAAYWAVVESATRSARWQMAWQAAVVWFIPSLLLYALGWATAWVRRGFRRGPVG